MSRLRSVFGRAAVSGPILVAKIKYRFITVSKMSVSNNKPILLKILAFLYRTIVYAPSTAYLGVGDHYMLHVHCTLYKDDVCHSLATCISPRHLA